VGCAVDDLRNVRVGWRAVHKTAEPQATGDAIQRTAAGEAKSCDQIKPADPRRLLRFGKVVIGTDLADEADVAVPLADLAGEIDQLAVAAERYEIRDRRRHVRKLNSELRKPAVGRFDDRRRGHRSTLSGKGFKDRRRLRDE